MQNLNLNNNEAIIILLRKFIINQIEKERILTQNKINLLLRYSLNKIFNYFSWNNNFISPQDIKKIFNSLDIELIQKVFEIYDKDKDSYLNFNEFKNFIFPKYIDINIDEIREKSQKSFESEEINSETEKIIHNIFQIEFQNIDDSSLLIQKIINNTDNSPNLNIYLHLFELIKGNDKNYDYLNEYIDVNDINKFLNINSKGIKIYEQDIANFIFRYNYENNLKLNIEEFTNMINYFLFNENYRNKSYNKNKLIEFKTRNNLFFDYSTLEINNSKISQIKKKNENNSFMNSISLSNKDNDDENQELNNNNKGNININSAINFKEKELRNLKINLLAEYFKHIIKQLDELEKNKFNLSKIIQSKELFSLFDIKNEFNICKDNFIKVFNDYFHILFKEEDFMYLIKKYDLNKDDKLNFEEFDFMISPISKINLTEDKNNIQTNPNNNGINLNNEEQKILISNLFVNLINCEKSIENEKKKLNEAPLFTSYEMFEFIRNKENKLLNSEDIFYFLKNNNVIIQNEQFDLLLNYLFFSTEKNKTYNFIDFIKII